MKKLALSIVALAGALTVPALAHHAFSAEFDSSKPITFKGVVTKIEWMNPHAWFYLDVKASNGEVEHWQFETGAPIELTRRGWRKNDLKVGDEVTVQAGEQGIRFLLVSGKPLEEPVAWYGPIVMNTEAELRQAMAEMRAGTFIKTGSEPVRR